MQLPTPTDIRQQLERWLAHAVAEVDPFLATRRALNTAAPPTDPPAIIALGKASEGMAGAAVAWLADHGLEPTGGIVVSDHFAGRPHHTLGAALGDHPVPGPRSQAASEALAAHLKAFAPATPVHVFLSGGTSALIAAPLDGISTAELEQAFQVFHHLGLDIATMNGLRGRLTRWSNGRLAYALGDRPVHAWVISDVVNDDLSIVGSGPLLTHAVSLDNVMTLLARPDITATLSPSIREALARPSTAIERDIPHLIVADGHAAAAAMSTAAQREGITMTLHRDALTGDATEEGIALGQWIHREIRRHRLPDRRSGILAEPVPRRGVAHVWRSETTIALPPSAGAGGRAQHMALSAARTLGRLGFPEAATVMVAATDGRDGPTDAAGAVIDAGTLRALQEAGVDVEQALERRDAYSALDRVGALLRTGRTGTNVADLVVVWVWNWY